MLERLLLITATKLESQPLHQTTAWERLEFPLGELYTGKIPQTSLTVHLAHLGIGKVNTAAGLALAIERIKPTSVIQFGIGGAYINSFLSIGMVMAAHSDIHIDSGVRTSEGWQSMEQVGFALLMKNTQRYFNTFPNSTALTQLFIDALGTTSGTFATSETITGTFDESVAIEARHDASVESMEGAAAAQVCLALGVPFAEIRGVSNIVGERDKKNWNIAKAVQRVNEAVIETLQFASKLKVN
jgi:futalosine hydrolase